METKWFHGSVLELALVAVSIADETFDWLVCIVIAACIAGAIALAVAAVISNNRRMEAIRRQYCNTKKLDNGP